MKETKRISKLFSSLYNGSPWIDVNLVNSLSGLDANKASSRPLEGCNTIWEIVNHIISWRENVLKRVQGEVIRTPSHNYFVPVKRISEKNWMETLIKLENSQKEWLIFLEKFNSKDFEIIYPNNRLSYYEHIHGIIQHDAYHLGQINILKKLVG